MSNFKSLFLLVFSACESWCIFKKCDKLDLLLLIFELSFCYLLRRIATGVPGWQGSG